MFEEVKPANKKNLYLIVAVGVIIFGMCGFCVAFGKFSDWLDTKKPNANQSNAAPVKTPAK